MTSGSIGFDRQTPIVVTDFWRKPRVSELGVYFRSATALRIRIAVSGEHTLWWPLMNSDTVVVDTPALWATSLIVAFRNVRIEFLAVLPKSTEPLPPIEPRL
jgi:hypothetical protein